ncbi:SusC/RagA family TonB-linked outer membrane protein [Ohtaekwangia kribbensis]|jgi:TonB-linked SusC/RagA family outer membrane protein|uniref:SusC/RagA family TonB-linked outer membrane protein n=1 Tax=Ohtaekwangia kribbensis TaxID=688913 RepID=A0ABW3K9I9_9BACT
MIKKLLFTMAMLITVCYGLQAQQKVITGKITDENGSELPGVNVLLKGTSLGTVSDQAGAYSLSIPESQSSGTLVFSFIGYLSEELAINNQTSVNIQMMPDIQTLSEVVVVGYGTQRREDISGAVSSVKASELPQVANTSIDNLLQGRAAGLNLTQRSAQPGGGLNVNIRGAISPNGNNTPLYVIDGVPVLNNGSAEPSLNDSNLGYYGGVDRNPLSSINPSDIESIDILKDASATAIYGSAAANGVVLITTKRGKAGAVTTEYRGSYTIQSPKDYYDLLDATQFMQQQNRLAKDKYLYDNGIAPYGTTDPSSVGAFTPKFTDEQIRTAGAGTDWTDKVMRNGSIQEHNISLSGGTDKTKLYTSFNYYNNKAILENSDFVRYTGRVNLEQKLGGRVKFGLNLTLSQINNNNASSGANAGGVEKYNMLQSAYAFSPTVGVYDEDGNYTKTFDPLITNPVAFLAIKDKTRTSRIIASPTLEVKITDALKGNVVVGIDKQSSTRNFYLPRAVQNSQLPEGMAQLGQGSLDNYTTEAFLTYDKKVGPGNLSLVLGAGYYNSVQESFSMQAVDFFTDALQYNNIGIGANKEKAIMSSYRSPNATKISQFFRANYSLLDKYIVTFTGRRDGSSTFPEDKYGFFPGISAAWRINQEDFLKNSTLISDLKLRAGYGTVGNDRISPTNALDLYESGFYYLIGNTYYNGVTLAQVGNQNLTWETDVMINVGLDFGLWSDRLSGSFEIYQRTAKDLLDFNRLPSNNADGQVAANVGSTRSQGIELSLTSTNVDNGSLRWTTTLNVSTFKAYWVERNPQVALPEYIGENDPINAVYGWRTDGIITSTGDVPSYMAGAKPGNIKYIDSNGDGELNSKDVVMLGNTSPKWNVGLGNTVTYKNFDLNFFFYGFLGQSAFNNYSGFYDPLRIANTNSQNTLTDVSRIWTAENSTGDLPGIASNPYSGSNPTGTHDFYLEKASFVRLKNITLGYRLPDKLWGNRKFIQSARVFVDVQNLAVFSNYNGYDPEFTEVNPYPQALSTTFGVNLKF